MLIQNEILDLVEQANPADPLKYVRNIVLDYAYDKMNTYIEKCHDCSSCSGCDIKSYPAGPLNAPVMIISEAITTQQVDNSADAIAPLQGSEAYDYIANLLSYLNVDIANVFWMNLVNCFICRQEGEKQVAKLPTSEEVNNCKVFANYAIDLVRPKMIILLGNVVANAFRNEPGSMTALRGTWMDIHGIPAMVTYNPDDLINLHGKISDEALNVREDDFYNDLDAAFSSFKEANPDCNIFLSNNTYEKEI